MIIVIIIVIILFCFFLLFPSASLGFSPSPPIFYSSISISLCLFLISLLSESMPFRLSPSSPPFKQFFFCFFVKTRKIVIDINCNNLLSYQYIVSVSIFPKNQNVMKSMRIINRFREKNVKNYHWIASLLPCSTSIDKIFAHILQDGKNHNKRTAKAFEWPFHMLFDVLHVQKPVCLTAWISSIVYLVWLPDRIIFIFCRLS